MTTATTTVVYRGMDRAALDAAYDNTAAVADSQTYRANWWERSAAIRAEPQSRLDLRYGQRPRATLDYFPAQTDAPLFVFIHGGYWQRNEKERFSFVAPGPRAHGINVALPGYTLGPDARMTEIVGEIREALTFLADRADTLGFDRARIYVGGWSAGGHLTAAVADHPSVRGGLPISGIFDLEPIALGVLNDKLALSTEEIESLSPLRNIPGRIAPQRIFVGVAELPELRRQSEEYFQALKARSLPATLTQLPGKNHFSIMEELARPNGALTRGLLELIAS
jgi:arylformamidase